MEPNSIHGNMLKWTNKKNNQTFHINNQENPKKSKPPRSPNKLMKKNDLGSFTGFGVSSEYQKYSGQYIYEGGPEPETF